MFRPYMWAIFRLRSNFSGAAIQEYGVFFGYWGLGRGRGGVVRYLVVSCVRLKLQYTEFLLFEQTQRG